MSIKKTLAPEDVLIAVISHYVNSEMSEKEIAKSNIKITGRFVDDEGTVELYIVDETSNNTLN